MLSKLLHILPIKPSFLIREIVEEVIFRGLLGSPGMYMINIKTENDITSKTIVVQ